jgi:hypothetical protein
MKPKMFNPDKDLAWYASDRTPYKLHTTGVQVRFARARYGVKPDNSGRLQGKDVAKKTKKRRQ